jgi:hypothetical protein
MIQSMSFSIGFFTDVNEAKQQRTDTQAATKMVDEETNRGKLVPPKAPEADAAGPSNAAEPAVADAPAEPAAAEVVPVEPEWADRELMPERDQAHADWLQRQTRLLHCAEWARLKAEVLSRCSEVGVFPPSAAVSSVKTEAASASEGLLSRGASAVLLPFAPAPPSEFPDEASAALQETAIAHSRAAAFGTDVVLLCVSSPQSDPSTIQASRNVFDTMIADVLRATGDADASGGAWSSTSHALVGAGKGVLDACKAMHKEFATLGPEWAGVHLVAESDWKSALQYVCFAFILFSCDFDWSIVWSILCRRADRYVNAVQEWSREAAAVTTSSTAPAPSTLKSGLTQAKAYAALLQVFHFHCVVFYCSE